MDNTQEYLKYLLNQEKWTAEQKEWMLEYLNSDDLSDLETVAAEEYQADLDTVKNILERRLSERILSNIHQQIGVAPLPAVRKVRRYRIGIAAAAAILIIAGAGYFFSSYINGFPNDLPMHKVVTGLHERKAVQLPDGSTVSLEPVSMLSYPASFSHNNREITLEGEAFFEVTKDTIHPFIIQTKSIRTTVLGTSFNVEAYDTANAKVVVITGLVKIQPVGQYENVPDVKAAPDQMAVFNNNTGKLELKNSPDEARYYRQRQAGSFIYQGETIGRVIEDLKRYYRRPVALQDNIKDCRFYGTLYTNDSLNKSLNLVAISLNAMLEENGNGYIINGGNCH